MGTSDKLLDKMRKNPKDWRIDDVIIVAKRCNLLIRAKGGSHHVFGYPGINESVTIPAHRPIKPIYIRRFVELIDKVKEAEHEKT